MGEYNINFCSLSKSSESKSLPSWCTEAKAKGLPPRFTFRESYVFLMDFKQLAHILSKSLILAEKMAALASIFPFRGNKDKPDELKFGIHAYWDALSRFA